MSQPLSNLGRLSNWIVSLRRLSQEGESRWETIVEKPAKPGQQVIAREFEVNGAGQIQELLNPCCDRVIITMIDKMWCSVLRKAQIIRQLQYGVTDVRTEVCTRYCEGN